MNLQDISQDLINTTMEILEARRNPELNPKIGPYTQLKKYVDDPSIFISFTEIDKIGINPDSRYATPLGIYTYPLQASWKKYKVDKIFDRFVGSSKEATVKTEIHVIDKAFPFATENPYIQVVQTKKPLTDLQDFSKRDLDDAIEQISRIIEEINTSDNELKQDAIQLFEEDYVKKIKNGTTNAKVNTPGGIFWWLAMNCLNMNSVGDLLLKKYKSKNSMRNWNFFLRDLGHDGFNDKGDGIIYNSEPAQAVFLHGKALKKIDMIYNNPSIKSRKKKRVYYWMNENEISDDARYTYDEKGDSYKWKSGTFIDGTWKGGYWVNGLWLDGVWEKGAWEDGIWKDGRFISGSFLGGTWKDGIFGKSGSPSGSMSISAVWEDGIWMNGTFRAKEWQDGIWKDGTFKTSIWRNGTWHKGDFEWSTWENGTWHDGKFKHSIWENGTWLFGEFENKKWLNGMWENGTFRGLWVDGTWKYGVFGVTSDTRSIAEPVWNNGVWENGLFAQGDFNGGLWKDGFWFLGKWNGGQWQEGSIYSKRFGPDFMRVRADEFLEGLHTTSSYLAANRKIENYKEARQFVESRVNPREFEQIENEVDTIEELEERVAP